jgi:hypothetical protein
LLFRIGQKTGQAVYTRSVTGAVLRHLLGNDARDSFLYDDQLLALFQQSLDAVSKEQNVNYFLDQSTGTSAALSTLAVAMQHPAFSEKLGMQMSDVLRHLFLHISSPFVSDEADQIAYIFYVAAVNRVLTPHDLTQELQMINGELRIGVDNAAPNDMLPFIRQQLWVHVLALGDAMFANARLYQETSQYIHALVHNWVVEIGFKPDREI